MKLHTVSVTAGRILAVKIVCMNCMRMVTCLPLMGVLRKCIFVFHRRTRKIYAGCLSFHYDSKRIILCTCMVMAQNQQSFCWCIMRVLFLIGDKCASDK